MSQITPSDRARLAELCGVSEAYLYQCMTGRRSMEAAEAVRIEEASGRQLRRWHLRVHDWHLIWPELIGAEGAPAANNPQSVDAA
jgi:DNA-binding transcriptional regulator YdaS (Cro superfamily)